MAEDKIQDKDSTNQTPKEEAPSVVKESPKKKTGGALSGLFRLFKKSKLNEDKFAGDAKSAPEIKKTAIGKQATFNAIKINLRTTNQVLVVVLVGLVILMFYVSLRAKPEISSVVAAIANIKLPEVESKVIVVFKEVSHYLDQIKKRDIFSVFVEKVEVPVVEPVEVPEPPPPPVVPIEEKAKNIKLIGISWGNNPKAMIKNTSSQGVQFFSIGEKIDGTDLEIKDILKGEVILTSEGQEMSLM